MRALKCAVHGKKLKRYVVILLLALLVVALAGCVEDDAGGDEGLDLGEPVDEVTNYVGTEGFGIEGDVQEKLEGEGSLYALVTEETEAQSSGPEIQHFAKFAEVTYLNNEGNDVKKYTINDGFVDLSNDEIRQIKEYSYREDQIIPLIEDLGGGEYDCSMLKELTEKEGYKYFFPGGETKGNDETIIANSRKPKFFFGRVGGEIDIIIFNQEVAKMKEMGIYTKFDTEDVQIGEIEWDQLLKLENTYGEKSYIELAPGVYCLNVGVHGNYRVYGTPEKEVCIGIKKAV